MGLPRLVLKHVWKNCFTTILLWSPTNSGVKIFVLITGFGLCNNTWTFIWCLASSDSFVSKKPENWSFVFKSILKLEHWNIKSHQTCYNKMCPSFLCTTSARPICGHTSMLNLDIKIKVSFASQKNYLSFLFLTIRNETFLVEFQPNIGEVGAVILVYEKVGGK